MLPEELWGIKFLLEYKPDLIEEYLDIYPDHISLLIELNLHGYPEYHELIEKYAKKYHYSPNQFLIRKNREKSNKNREKRRKTEKNGEIDRIS